MSVVIHWSMTDEVYKNYLILANRPAILQNSHRVRAFEAWKRIQSWSDV